MEESKWRSRMVLVSFALNEPLDRFPRLQGRLTGWNARRCFGAPGGQFSTWQLLLDEGAMADEIRDLIKDSLGFADQECPHAFAVAAAKGITGCHFDPGFSNATLGGGDDVPQ